MQPTDDSALLRRYVETRSDECFAALVARHVNLVYSVAMRCVGDPHQAEEIAQAVFILLANQAATLRHDKALSSWLFQTTRLTASNSIRSETRRHRRELEAHMQSQLNQPGDDLWQRIAPLLDDAVADLNDADRRAILLRFYEGRSLREVGAALDASDDAAQKRFTRAVERLREFFAKRGVTVGASGLTLVVSANAVHAAPVGLAVTISTAPGLAGPAIVTTATATITKAITMTTTQKAIIATVVLLLCGAATVVVNNGMKARTSAGTAAVVNLDHYVGRFEMPGRRIDIQKKDTGISVFIDGQPAFVAYSQSAEKFVSRDPGSITELTFVNDAAGRPVQFTLVRDGRKLGELKRPENAK